MLVTRGDHALAQDVTQSAFAAAAAEWPRLRRLGEPQHKGWLKRVAAHKAIDEFRRNGTPEAHRSAVWERCRPREPDTHHAGLIIRRSSIEARLFPPTSSHEGSSMPNTCRNQRPGLSTACVCAGQRTIECGQPGRLQDGCSAY